MSLVVITLSIAALALAGLFFVAMVVIKDMEGEIKDLRIGVEVSEFQAERGEQTRCLKILEDLKTLCPSSSLILDRAAERIKEGK